MHKSYTLKEAPLGTRCYVGVLAGDQCAAEAKVELKTTSKTSPWYTRKFYCCYAHAKSFVQGSTWKLADA